MAIAGMVLALIGIVLATTAHVLSMSIRHDNAMLRDTVASQKREIEHLGGVVESREAEINRLYQELEDD